VSNKTARIPIRSFRPVKTLLEYAVFPYADFRAGPPTPLDSFKLGHFNLWKDTSENWNKYLSCPRPSQHLAIYVDKRGNPLTSMWLATRDKERQGSYEDWNRLTSVLFYLAWARTPYITLDRAAAEDFYFESFVVPEGGQADSSTHVRWSKFGTSVRTGIKIHPPLEVSLGGNQIELPAPTSSRALPFFDPTPGELFKRLEAELAKPESRLLTGLWFLHQASYRSAYRSSFAEDIQNVCSAFEAILDVTKRGYSTEQVADCLKQLFSPLAPSTVESACSIPASSERADVLAKLDEWINALYSVRNDYTHGKVVTSYVFGERSIWQDAFEIFRLAANRKLLGAPEKHPSHGSSLEKRLMSVTYFDEAVDFFKRKDGEWMAVETKDEDCVRSFKEIIRKCRVLDPQLVESIPSLSQLRRALFNVCTKICGVLEKAEAKYVSAESAGILNHLHVSFDRSSEGKLNVDAYLREVVPRLMMWVPAIPLEGGSIVLYELVEAFKNLVSVYSNFSHPIVNTLAQGLPSP
jgi:hypothetical protein